MACSSRRSRKNGPQESILNGPIMTKEKTGVFTGATPINPANEEEIPIWIADYVLMGYGTGAIMGVPAHDKRDLEFARKFDLPIVVVVQAPARGGTSSSIPGEGIAINSRIINGLRAPEAKKKITKWLEQRESGQRRDQLQIARLAFFAAALLG